jgi:hypothetical protein
MHEKRRERRQFLHAPLQQVHINGKIMSHGHSFLKFTEQAEAPDTGSEGIPDPLEHRAPTTP